MDYYGLYGINMGLYGDITQMGVFNGDLMAIRWWFTGIFMGFHGISWEDDGLSWSHTLRWVSSMIIHDPQICTLGDDFPEHSPYFWRHEWMHRDRGLETTYMWNMS